MRIMRSHLICLGCRHAFKKASPVPVPCPTCRVPMIDAGEQLAVPPRRDLDGWYANAKRSPTGPAVPSRKFSPTPTPGPKKGKGEHRRLPRILPWV
ncbi:hypothetical protein [Streptomyces luteolus]|uniref:Uncharacterized protein n=1 Tax=Streptomyces luteolus TaxID=3043615 RepID=A0ABT6SRX0_9ACTN|nr:hypothetical protein [Streptomyces sp. B-S-A12]MDI3418357.1 hypothetical protein [Streptomyces sp. B-S-A12]